jgi:hypothetical protein
VIRCGTGDNLRFVLHYRCDQPIPRPVIGVNIAQVGGSIVTAPTTRDIGLVPDALRGSGTIEVRADAITLLPGTYDFSTLISDFNKQHVFDHLQTALRFDVMTGRPYETEGMVSVLPQWTIS